MFLSRCWHQPTLCVMVRRGSENTGLFDTRMRTCSDLAVDVIKHLNNQDICLSVTMKNRTLNLSRLSAIRGEIQRFHSSGRTEGVQIKTKNIYRSKLSSCIIVHHNPLQSERVFKVRKLTAKQLWEKHCRLQTHETGWLDGLQLKTINLSSARWPLTFVVWTLTLNLQLSSGRSASLWGQICDAHRSINSLLFYWYQVKLSHHSSQDTLYY